MKTQEQEMDMANDGTPPLEPLSPILANDTLMRDGGDICFANASRFIESNFSVPLTTYATGWKDPNRLDVALEFVAPMVSVGRRFEFMQATNAEEFISEIDDVRGIGADFNRVEFTSSKVNSKTLNKGLTMRIDLDEVNDLPNYQEIYTGRLMRRLLRNELRRAVNILVAAAQSNATPAPDQNPQAVTWNTTSGRDADMDLTDCVTRYFDGAGLGPTRCLFAHNAWNLRKRCLRNINVPGGYLNSNMSEAEVAAFLGLDSVYVSKERMTTGTRLTPTKTTVVGPVSGQGATYPVVIYLAEAGQTPEDPSNIKRFVSATVGGTPFRVYVAPYGSKFMDITVEHYSLTVATSTLGVQLLNISPV